MFISNLQNLHQGLFHSFNKQIKISTMAWNFRSYFKPFPMEKALQESIIGWWTDRINTGKVHTQTKGLATGGRICEDSRNVYVIYRERADCRQMVMNRWLMEIELSDGSCDSSCSFFYCICSQFLTHLFIRPIEFIRHTLSAQIFYLERITNERKYEGV